MDLMLKHLWALCCDSHILHRALGRATNGFDVEALVGGRRMDLMRQHVWTREDVTRDWRPEKATNGFDVEARVDACASGEKM